VPQQHDFSQKIHSRQRFLVLCLSMARLARVVGVDVVHHVTQRGNGRQFVLAADAERMVYLDLLRQAVLIEGLSVVGY
jgi:putative transposase